MFQSPANLFFGLSLFLALALSSAPVPGAATGSALLWRIESDHAAPSYLFGTIHAEDPRVLGVMDQVTDELQHASLFVMELEPRPDTIGALSRHMHFSDGRSLRSVVSAATFESAVQAMTEYKVPQGLVIKMKPWAVVLTLSVPPPRTGFFLDMALYMAALRQEIPVLGLESVDEQLEFFDQLPMDKQVELLEETLDTRDILGTAFEELVDAYLKRDLALMDALNDKYLALSTPEIANLFRTQLLYRRNARMLDRLLPVLEAGNAFIAVGALHLPGEHGLLEGLKARGYRVRPVY